MSWRRRTELGTLPRLNTRQDHHRQRARSMRSPSSSPTHANNSRIRRIRSSPSPSPSSSAPHTPRSLTTRPTSPPTVLIPLTPRSRTSSTPTSPTSPTALTPRRRASSCSSSRPTSPTSPTVQISSVASLLPRVSPWTYISRDSGAKDWCVGEEGDRLRRMLALVLFHHQPLVAMVVSYAGASDPFQGSLLHTLTLRQACAFQLASTSDGTLLSHVYTRPDPYAGGYTATSPRRGRNWQWRRWNLKWGSHSRVTSATKLTGRLDGQMLPERGMGVWMNNTAFDQLKTWKDKEYHEDKTLPAQVIRPNGKSVDISLLQSSWNHRSDNITAILALPDGRVAFGTKSGVIRIIRKPAYTRKSFHRWSSASWTYEAKDYELDMMCLGHTDEITALVALPDGYIASGSKDQSVLVFDCAENRADIVFGLERVKQAKCVQKLGGNKKIATMAAFPDGRLCVGSEDSTILVINWRSTAVLKRLTTNLVRLTAMIVLKGDHLAVAAENTSALAYNNHIHIFK